MTPADKAVMALLGGMQALVGKVILLEECDNHRTNFLGVCDRVWTMSGRQWLLVDMGTANWVWASFDAITEVFWDWEA